MAESTLTYKCPNCDAGLVFDASKQRFACEFCLSDFSEDDLKGTESAAREEKIEAENKEFSDAVKEYNCPSCGAEIIADSETVADFCYYCHNPVVLADKVSGVMRPSKIIPFKFDKEEAKATFLRYAKKKKFLPRDYFTDEHADKITGVYYPFWVTDADTYSTLDTHARRVRSWIIGNVKYTEVSRFAISRHGKIHFEDITSLAMTSGDEKMLEGILPYPADVYTDFEMPYLHGFFAKKRNIEREALNTEVRERMNGYASTLLHRTVNGYTSVDSGRTLVTVDRASWEYSLLPIWQLTYKHKKKKKIYTYAMNGYTGKIYGELPVSIPKLLLFFGGLALSLATVFFLIGGFLL